MTSSTEAPVLVPLAPLATPELRGGDWTRYAGSGALGDRVTEQALAALADRALDAARSRGYATGWAQGRQQAATEARDAAILAAAQAAEAEERRQVEHDQALRRLVEATRLLQDTAAAVATRLEDHCLDLAYELTEALVGHQLRTADDPAADLRERVRAVVEVLPGGVPVTVRAHPQLAGRLRELLRPLGAGLVEDPTLGLHDAVVETETASVDLAVGAALARVREALS